jgi:hypothetical protein
MDGKAAISRCCLSFGASDVRTLLDFRMQKYRETAPTATNPEARMASGVAPTTTQSRSVTGRPSNSSRTAPPTMKDRIGPV